MKFGVILAVLLAVLVFCTQPGCGGPDVDAPLVPLSDASRTVKLSDFRGKVVLVDFWATWCGPCRESMPVIQRIYERYKGKGVEVVSITAEARSTVEQFERQSAHDYPVYLDSSGQVTAAFGVDSIPRYVVLGKDGKVVGNMEGALSNGEQLSAMIEDGLR